MVKSLFYSLGNQKLGNFWQCNVHGIYIKDILVTIKDKEVNDIFIVIIQNINK
jgi:hypothetical protein